jgi:hypothetical protein
MTKFDTDNADHINLFNALANKALEHFDRSAGLVYVSDCIRDVECLAHLPVGQKTHWLVSKTGTWLCAEREKAMDIFHRNFNFCAVYTIEHCETEYGTKWFKIDLAE